MGVEESNHWYFLLIGIIIPYAGRALEKAVFQKIWNLCKDKFCGGRDPLHEALMPTTDRPYDEHGKKVWIASEAGDSEEILAIKKEANDLFSEGILPCDVNNKTTV
jgi:hypothetical protein